MLAVFATTAAITKIWTWACNGGGQKGLSAYYLLLLLLLLLLQLQLPHNYNYNYYERISLVLFGIVPMIFTATATVATRLG